MPRKTVTFKEAQGFRLMFGKYRGETLDDIASTDEGLKYLDWLLGESDANAHSYPYLSAYMNDPSIKRELENL